MKSIAYISLIAACGILLSCEKIKDFFTFDISYTSTVVIPSNSGLNIPIDIKTPEMETNAQQKFENNNTQTKYVKSIKLSKMEMVLTSPQSSDLSFLNSIEIYIKADDEPEVMIAWKNDIPENVGQTLELETSSEDLKPYVVSDAFTLRVKSTTDEVITQEHEIDVNSNFEVKAQLID